MHLSTGEQSVDAVAAALGKTTALVRHCVFHLDQPTSECDQRPSRSRTRQRSTNDDDTLDIGSIGIEWDAHLPNGSEMFSTDDTLCDLLNNRGNPRISSDGCSSSMVRHAISG